MEDFNYPKIVFVQVYTIGEKPVFYSHPDQQHVYCLPDKKWIDKPSYLDYCNSRDLEPVDMPDVILHDLVPPEEFEQLKGMGLIEPTLEALYTKIQELKAHLQSVGISTDEPADAPVIDAVPEFAQPDNGNQPNSMSNGIAKVLEMIHASVSNPGLVGEIRKCVEGLTEQEKDMVKLITKYFGRPA